MTSSTTRTGHVTTTKLRNELRPGGGTMIGFGISINREAKPVQHDKNGSVE